jgi:hypothetical protein
MFRFLIGLFLLSSCSLGVKKSGGESPYFYDVFGQYSLDDLKSLSPQLVTTLSRNPQQGKLEDLFSKKQAPIKRVGILVFESMLQPTISGLSNEDKIFLSEQGKFLKLKKAKHLKRMAPKLRITSRPSASLLLLTIFSFSLPEKKPPCPLSLIREE